MKSALFTGSEFFSICEKPVKYHVKILISLVFSQVNSQVSHRKFTGFYPIVCIDNDFTGLDELLSNSYGDSLDDFSFDLDALPE